MGDPLGAVVRITTVDKRVHEGELFWYDIKTSSLLLKKDVARPTTGSSSSSTKPGVVAPLSSDTRPSKNPAVGREQASSSSDMRQSEDALDPRGTHPSEEDGNAVIKYAHFVWVSEDFITDARATARAATSAEQSAGSKVRSGREARQSALPGSSSSSSASLASASRK
ncbi:unnamed protein product [Amoebophrya sp. A25]|nr:unnamed protein product [Amoebophrya sp. A25]|eukprot:GSA25T00025163001.1